MYSLTFIIITTLALGGACIYALWYSEKHGRQE